MKTLLLYWGTGAIIFGLWEYFFPNLYPRLFTKKVSAKDKKKEAKVYSLAGIICIVISLLI